MHNRVAYVAWCGRQNISDAGKGTQTEDVWSAEKSSWAQESGNNRKVEKTA